MVDLNPIVSVITLNADDLNITINRWKLSDGI